MSTDERRPTMEAPHETPAKKSSDSVPAATVNGVESAARNADRWWWSTATTGIEWLCRTRSSWTVDDLRDLGVPEADAACRWGSLIAAAWRSGQIEPIGARVSPIDGRLVRVWTAVAR